MVFLLDSKLLPELQFDEMVTLQQDRESESIFQKYRGQSPVDFDPEICANFMIELVVGDVVLLSHAVGFGTLNGCKNKCLKGCNGEAGGQFLKLRFASELFGKRLRKLERKLCV